jgi:ABC-type lipoprotein release transport system permease subunit
VLGGSAGAVAVLAALSTALPARRAAVVELSRALKID